MPTTVGNRSRHHLTDGASGSPPAGLQVDIGLDVTDMVDRVRDLGIGPHEVTRGDVAAPARIRQLDPGGRPGLSLGDRLCLAFALRLDLPVISADPVWADIDLPIEVVPVR